MPGGSESHLLTITIVDLENPDNDGILIEQVIQYGETQSFVTSKKPQLLLLFWLSPYSVLAWCPGWEGLG